MLNTSILVWVANALLIVGTWQLGNNKRHSLLLIALGEILWMGYAYSKGEHALTFICVVFLGLYLRAWFKWNEKVAKPHEKLVQGL